MLSDAVRNGAFTHTAINNKLLSASTEACPARSPLPHTSSTVNRKYAWQIATVVLAVILACTSSLLAGCGASNTQNANASQSSGTPFVPAFHTAEFSPEAAEGTEDALIDFSHAQDGTIGASAKGESRMKLQVTNGEQSYNYDLPNDGTPIIVPVNMGNGDYTARIMLNTSGDRYVEVFSTTASITLADENAPFVRPNTICNYTQDSACVTLANELCANAATESDAFDAIFDYICNNITYDFEKANQLADATGYIPNPDETLASGKGICFDYASLAAAMLRSQGIPTKILTGYVAPDNVYHAWDMIYIDGAWVSLHISAQPGEWARADMTFAANGAEDAIGDGSAYADRYTY